MRHAYSVLILTICKSPCDATPQDKTVGNLLQSPRPPTGFQVIRRQFWLCSIMPADRSGEANQKYTRLLASTGPRLPT
ncbi:hypothetical protein F4778DRAFT_735006 [Xylariomycetidae sp. FL2044]|nr:hypothetical protein F4778DRAFT_735006 [Xylariomycetidae sp. FL2044]